MMKWFIVGGDWKTPMKKPSGSGNGKNMRSVCRGVKHWVNVNMPELSDRIYWQFTELGDEQATVIDFGSHWAFARVEGKEEDKK